MPDMASTTDSAATVALATNRRTAGVLLHVSSLPSRFGIGDLGPDARHWIDALARAGQTWWQILPLGPTGYGDSPYQCYSAFAGNTLFISPQLLVDEGLLKQEDLNSPPSFPEGVVDYDAVALYKQELTAKAWENFQSYGTSAMKAAWEEFRKIESAWLEDFGFFLALKNRFNLVSWQEWPEPYRLRDEATLATAKAEMTAEIDFACFRQFLFARQWQALRAYAEERKVRLIGDLPIFVALDSADVWTQPELFRLDDAGRPTVVSGVPPDYFSRTGQLWGNPLYDWDAHRRQGYAWWIQRLRAVLKQVHMVRLDHFRGFEACWEVPYGNPTAEHGAWMPGSGAELFEVARVALGGLPLIAEDLGMITPAVDAIRVQFDLPGMRILQFAYGGSPEIRFLPHNYERRTVVYTGTHDNETTTGWAQHLSPDEQAFFRRHIPETADSVAWQLIRVAWSSIADLAIVPMQDILDLDNVARMNLPGTASGNWRWRLKYDQITPQHWQRLAELTGTFQRWA